MLGAVFSCSQLCFLACCRKHGIRSMLTSRTREMPWTWTCPVCHSPWLHHRSLWNPTLWGYLLGRPILVSQNPFVKAWRTLCSPACEKLHKLVSWWICSRTWLFALTQFRLLCHLSVFIPPWEIKVMPVSVWTPFFISGFLAVPALPSSGSNSAFTTSKKLRRRCRPHWPWERTWVSAGPR